MMIDGSNDTKNRQSCVHTRAFPWDGAGLVKSGFSVWLALPDFLNTGRCPMSFHTTGEALGSFQGWVGTSLPPFVSSFLPGVCFGISLPKLVNSQPMPLTASLPKQLGCHKWKEARQEGKASPWKHGNRCLSCVVSAGHCSRWTAERLRSSGTQAHPIRSPHLPVTVT